MASTSAAVKSAGAFGLRLHFDNFDLPAGSEPVQFVNLTNSDIDTILAVKAEMQEAKIQADFGF